MIRRFLTTRAPLLFAALLLLAMAKVEEGAAALSGRPLARSLLAPIPVREAPLTVGRLVLIAGRPHLIDLSSVRGLPRTDRQPE